MVRVSWFHGSIPLGAGNEEPPTGHRPGPLWGKAALDESFCSWSPTWVFGVLNYNKALKL
jgi:hypothetical protein